ncbi:MAG: hypothetical protein WCO56_03310 [Verrucomicrobiota bacterium]
MNINPKPGFRIPKWRPSFALIGAIRGRRPLALPSPARQPPSSGGDFSARKLFSKSWLRPSALASSGYNFFASKFFCHVRLPIFMPVHFSAKVFGFRSCALVSKKSFSHNFVTICVKKSNSSQEHHNFQNCTTHPRRSRRRESAQTKQPTISQLLMNQVAHKTAPFKSQKRCRNGAVLAWFSFQPSAPEAGFACQYSRLLPHRWWHRFITHEW